MHSAIQSAIGQIIGTLIISVFAIALALLVMLIDPEFRARATFKLSALGGLLIGSLSGVLAGAVGIWESLSKTPNFTYQPSVPTFLTLTLIFAAIAAWTAWRTRRVLRRPGRNSGKGKDTA